MKQNRCMPRFLPRKHQWKTCLLCKRLSIWKGTWNLKGKKPQVSGADRSQPCLGFYFDRRHWAEGCLWLEAHLVTEGLVEVFKSWALLQCLTVGAPLALAPLLLSWEFGGIKKKSFSLLWVCHEWARERMDVSFLELFVQSFICCIGRAPRIKGNSVVPELGVFSLPLALPSPPFSL